MIIPALTAEITMVYADTGEGVDDEFQFCCLLGQNKYAMVYALDQSIAQYMQEKEAIRKEVTRRQIILSEGKEANPQWYDIPH